MGIPLIKVAMTKPTPKNCGRFRTKLLHGSSFILGRSGTSQLTWRTGTARYDKKDVTDPFVDVKLGKARIAKTAVIDNDLNPKWNET